MANPAYYIINNEGTGEIVEKKSRFIGEVFRITSEEEALAAVERVRKKYYDARHHCYAFICGPNAEIRRFSDDGEPSGSAGKPIMSVLEGENLNNICLVVTRYFGGTLLGVGGLVRAYTDAAKEAVTASGKSPVTKGKSCTVTVTYNDIGRFKHLFEQSGIRVKNEEYTDQVTFSLVMEEAVLEGFVRAAAEYTGGRCIPNNIEDIYF